MPPLPTGAADRSLRCPLVLAVLGLSRAHPDPGLCVHVLSREGADASFTRPLPASGHTTLLPMPCEWIRADARPGPERSEPWARRRNPGRFPRASP
jgi:hypothetical protein